MVTRVGTALVLSLVLSTGYIVTARSDPTEVLDTCEQDGRTAGIIASRAACAGLLNRCPLPEATAKSAPERPRAVARNFHKVLDRSCDVLFVESCKSQGTAEVLDGNVMPHSCGAILHSGPGKYAEDCPDHETAVEIFTTLLAELCTASTPSPPPPPPAPKEVLLSRGKHTFQSSTILDGSSDKAVDGNKNTDFSAGSCTHTGVTSDIQTTLYPWWTVDLGATMKVTRVEITNRSDCCGDRLQDFQILVGDKRPSRRRSFRSRGICASNLSVAPGETASFDCPAVGRFVTIRIPGFDVLTLCEVEVFGEEITGPSQVVS